LVMRVRIFARLGDIVEPHVGVGRNPDDARSIRGKTTITGKWALARVPEPNSGTDLK
jgi:hypothetical protein